MRFGITPSGAARKNLLAWRKSILINVFPSLMRKPIFLYGTKAHFRHFASSHEFFVQNKMNNKDLLQKRNHHGLFPRI